MVQGRYEVLLREALEEIEPGPWSARHLDLAKKMLTQEFCSAFDRDCDKDAVIDWLNSLAPSDVADLIDGLNASPEDME